MIRQATREDIEELAHLWARAFPGERTAEQRIRDLEMGGVFGGIEHAWIDEREGRMVGAFRAYSLTQHLHGTAFRMMGLAAVAVDETARRRGVGRQLCEHAVHTARERGDILSVLYPFRPAFYQALGWGLVGEMHAYRFAPEALVRAGGGAVWRAGGDDTGVIAACYARVAESANGLIARTPRIWRSHIEDPGTHVYVTGAESAARGYLIVRFGRSGSPDDRPLYVRELVAETQDAYDALLGWIADQRDTWRVVHYDAAPDERFAHRLREPRPPGFHPARYLWAPVARIIRGPMLRILDVPAALQQRRRWGPAAPLRFSLHILDAMVPANEGPFAIDYDGQRATVQPGNGGRPLLRTSAATFAQIYAGELTIRDALTLGLAERDGDVETIDALFRTDRCFRLLDEF